MEHQINKYFKAMIEELPDEKGYRRVKIFHVKEILGTADLTATGLISNGYIIYLEQSVFGGDMSIQMIEAISWLQQYCRDAIDKYWAEIESRS